MYHSALSGISAHIGAECSVSWRLLEGQCCQPSREDPVLGCICLFLMAAGVEEMLFNPRKLIAINFLKYINLSFNFP